MNGKKYYISIRVVEADSQEEAIEKIQDVDFAEDHDLCDQVIELDKIKIKK